MIFTMQGKKVDADSLSEEERIHLLEQDHHIIKFITNPSNKCQLIALKQDPWLISTINNPKDDICKYALNINVNVFRTIKNPSKSVIFHAIKNFKKEIQLCKMYGGTPNSFLIDGLKSAIHYIL